MAVQQQTQRVDYQEYVSTQLKTLQQCSTYTPEPTRGALEYANLIASNPQIDAKFCQQAGKVVRIAAQFSVPTTQPATIRGSLYPLTWTENRCEDEQAEQKTSEQAEQKTFTFHVPPEHMNKELQFKFCTPLQDKMLWSSGKNFSIDLSRYGHIVKVDVQGVSFS